MSSETKQEHEECKARHGGRTPAQRCVIWGAFDTRTTAAHCVWAEEEDIEIFSEKGVTVVTCPVSNLKLASGVCNVPALMKKGVNVAIGTDSVASNNSLNFIEEMKFFALLNKERRNDPTLITPKETLRAAARAGALSQGREDCGVLAVGQKSRSYGLDIGQPHMRPVHNLANNISIFCFRQRCGLNHGRRQSIVPRRRFSHDRCGEGGGRDRESLQRYSSSALKRDPDRYEIWQRNHFLKVR